MTHLIPLEHTGPRGGHGGTTRDSSAPGRGHRGTVKKHDPAHGSIGVIDAATVRDVNAVVAATLLPLLVLFKLLLILPLLVLSPL